MRRWYVQARMLVLRPAVAIIIIWIGLFAGIWGLAGWYGPTFAQYPAWQWPFVPDCPLFALLFAGSLALLLVGRNWAPYNAWVALGLIKYGVWTVVMWTLFWTRGGAVDRESITMTVAHVGMVLEGLFLFSFLRIDWPTVLWCALWFGLSDWMDYGPFKTYPALPGLVPLAPMQWHTVGITVALTVVYAIMAWRRRRAPAGEDR